MSSSSSSSSSSGRFFFKNQLLKDIISFVNENSYGGRKEGREREMMIQCRVYLCATYILLHFLYIYFVCVDVVHVVVVFFILFFVSKCVLLLFFYRMKC